MLTVANFTAEFSQMRCVAGFNGIDREITSFSIIDTPEILNFLHGGEFVVDAGYFSSHFPYLLNGFVPALKEKGCAALGVKIHRYHEKVPDILLKEGNAYGFPIFELPADLYFCDFAFLIYRRLFKDQMDDTFHLATAYKDIVGSFCRFRSPEKILYELNLALNNPVFLLNSKFELMEYSYSQETALLNRYFPLLEGNTAIFDIDLKKTLQKLYTQQPYKYHQFLLNQGACHTNCILLYAGEKNGESHFLIILEINPLKSWHHQLLKDISELLKLADSSNTSSDFVSSVLAPPSVPTGTIIHYCTLYNFDYTKQRVCIVIELRDLLAFSSTRKYAIRDLMSVVIERIMVSTGCRIFYTKHEAFYVLYLLFPKDIAQMEAEVRAAQAAEGILEILEKNGFHPLLGVSTCDIDPKYIPRAFHKTIDAIKLGKGLYPTQKIFSLRSMHIYQWMSSTMSTDDLKHLYADTVEPLKKASTPDIDYIRIIEEYIGCQFNVSKTAKSLYVHRNTIMNHLNKMKGLLLFDIEQPENMTKLQLGLHAMRLLESNRNSN